MKVVISLTTVCAVSLLGAAAAQQQEPTQPQTTQPQTTQPEATRQTREGIPVTQHQEEALKDIGPDAMRRLDEDGDGSISREEAAAEPTLAERWDEYDRNSDQVLDSDELSALGQPGSFEEQDVEIARGEVTEEGLPTTRHQQEVTGEQQAPGGLIERLDTDADGAISKSEAQGSTRLVEQWDQLDRNGDGQLDSSELGGLAE